MLKADSEPSEAHQSYLHFTPTQEQCQIKLSFDHSPYKNKQAFVDVTKAVVKYTVSKGRHECAFGSIELALFFVFAKCQASAQTDSAWLVWQSVTKFAALGWLLQPSQLLLLLSWLATGVSASVGRWAPERRKRSEGRTSQALMQAASAGASTHNQGARTGNEKRAIVPRRDFLGFYTGKSLCCATLT
jgi:hypothetical protein